MTDIAALREECGHLISPVLAAAECLLCRHDAALSELEQLRLDNQALTRECERLRHGTTIEGDFVCPNEFDLQQLRAEVARWQREAEIASQDETTAREVLRAEHQECQRLRGARNGAHAALAALSEENARLRLALDSLRRDVDGYDTCFAFASWLADGEPGHFSDYCEAYESGDREARLAAIRAEAERSGT